MTSAEQDSSTKKAILITRIVGWDPLLLLSLPLVYFFTLAFFHKANAIPAD